MAENVATPPAKPRKPRKVKKPFVPKLVSQENWDALQPYIQHELKMEHDPKYKAEYLAKKQESQIPVLDFALTPAEARKTGKKIPPVPDPEKYRLKTEADMDAALKVAADWLASPGDETEKHAFTMWVDVLNAQMNDDPGSFASFYRVIHGRDLPAHALSWVAAAYKVLKGEAEGKDGVVIEAFRGSGKTTALTITFTAYRLGKRPDTANLLIQVGDDIAQDNTKQIGDIIEFHPGWKQVFPGVEPDKERGWGAGGYEIKRTDMPYDEWRAHCASRKDPTLVGVGYKSREIIGKHPTGLLLIDDIHDENNTSSQRELETVRKILTGTIFPTKMPGTLVIFVGTPWVNNDVLGYAKGTGQFISVRTPAFEEDPTGKWSSNGRRIKLAWPEVLTPKELANRARLVGRLEFARMYRLDLEAASNRIFKYQTYPSSSIQYKWPYVGGCDYAGSADAWRNKAGQGDYFALAYVAKLPGGGAVVVDGILVRCTQGEAETHLHKAQELYPFWLHTVVEGDGKGEEFIQVVRRNPALRIIPMKTGGKGKDTRLVKQMGPWLENGAVKISDAETPFLNELRFELDNFPLCPHDDALDAVYWALRGMPEVLSVPADEMELPGLERRKRSPNPFISLGRR